MENISKTSVNSFYGMSSTALTASATTSTNVTDPTLKRYSLVKWLENSQFDSQNEWLGRLTSVQHSNIIDFDADELKAGMEINVIRNNGEIWRAQVIIPKTASNTIDLPPSSVKKIRTKAMGSTGSKTIASLDHHDTSSSSLDQTTLIDLNDLSSTDLTHTNTVPINLTTLNTTSTNNANNSLIILTAQPTSSATPVVASPLNSNNNNKKINNNKQEWQFLQTALNDDFYTTSSQEQSNNTVIKLNNLTPITLTPTTTTTTTNSNSHQQIITVSDSNIETILQMQCDLLEQQKELKTIEIETMEQLRLLQQNLGKLAHKFDSFETTCAKYFSLPNGDLTKAKNVLNKFSSSIELIKDLQTASVTSMPTLGPSTSTLSSSSSPSTNTTTVTLTNDLVTHNNNNNNKPTTTIVNLLPSSSTTPTTTITPTTTTTSSAPTTTINIKEDETNNENLDQSSNLNQLTQTTNNKTTTRSQGMRNKRFKLV